MLYTGMYAINGEVINSLVYMRMSLNQAPYTYISISNTRQILNFVMNTFDAKVNHVMCELTFLCNFPQI